MNIATKKCILLQLVGLTILTSWFWSPTHAFWERLDIASFYYFNGWVATNHAAQVFWAWMNYRPIDLITFAIMLTPFVIPGFAFPKGTLLKHSLRLVILMTVLVLLRFAVNQVLGIHRESPSLVLSPVNWLHKLVPAIHAKDKANGSFPGDHAAVIFCWLGYLLIHARKSWKMLAIVIGLFFSLPRLVSGAHWLSDDVVGGVFLACISIAWVIYTPLAAYCENIFNHYKERLCSGS